VPSTARYPRRRCTMSLNFGADAPPLLIGGSLGIEVSASHRLEVLRRRGPQLTALFTSAPIRASTSAVNSFSAKEVGHMAPSSSFAASLKPNVAYLDLNFCASGRGKRRAREDRVGVWLGLSG
jgi:hypothetical protein